MTATPCDFKPTARLERGLPRWECRRCGGYQLAERPGLAQCRAAPARGLGDTLRKVTAALRIPHCGGCDERQHILNQWFPYSAEQDAPGSALGEDPLPATSQQSLAALLTVGITAFERPEHLSRCVTSLRQYYPKLPMIVADSGRARPELPEDIELLELPWDAGLSAARNVLAQACRTPYLLIGEDDFVFRPSARIEMLLDVLEHDSKIAVAGGSILDGPLLRPGAFDFNVADGVLRATPAARPLEKTAAGTEYRRCHKIANFFLARAETLRRHPWPDELKVGEHAVWFWLLHQAGVAVAHVQDVAIEHEWGGRPAQYVEHRQRAEPLRDAWFAARGLRYHQQKHSLRRDTFGSIGAGHFMVEQRPNIVVLGVGHSGTTILVRLLGALGWLTEGLDEEYAEPPAVREANELLRRTGRLPADAWQLLLRRGPWVVKDPRFVFTLDRWHAHLRRASRPQSLLLVWITRDDAATAASYLRRGRFGGDAQRALTEVRSRRGRAAEQYSRWPWAKLHVNYEQLREAARLFDVSRG